MVAQCFVMKLLFADVVVSFLVLLFGYTALSKALSPAPFAAVLQQVMPKTGAAVTAFLIPTLEAVTVLLLLFPTTRLKGLYLSAALLGLFTGYLVIMLLTMPHLPCSCGGIVSQMSWKQHVVFNLGFLFLTVAAIRREKRSNERQGIRDDGWDRKKFFMHKG